MKSPKIIKRSKQFCFDHVSNKVSLDYFLDWIKENVPKNADDITIGLEDEFNCMGGVVGAHIVMEWKEEK